MLKSRYDNVEITLGEIRPEGVTYIQVSRTEAGVSVL
jgi:hypothetical protein